MTNFTQPQREALIELMCLAILTDGRVSPAEEKAMERALKKLGWESDRPREFVLLKALTEARDLVNDEKCLVSFLAIRAGLFETKEEHELALKFLMMVLEIDGMGEDKDTFLARVQAAFND
ncbi:MAG TPA: hypothetical protein VG796_30840 [Verrucomicrobiales bacterium]|jgi:hypothetical protein|nr:hypothetical protein [Verrucomicrobiales bacterium]